MSSPEGERELPDDLLAPDDEDVLPKAEPDDAPGIQGEEHLGLTPPG
jgi:hypothetical protein